MSEAPTRESKVTLREINADTVRTVCNLKVADTQAQFVAPNAVSIAQAHFSDVAYFRAVYADDTPVGFIMLSDDVAKAEYFLWRYMIDEQYQGMGFGAQAIRLMTEYVRTRPNAKRFLTSVVARGGEPPGLLREAGFQADRRRGRRRTRYGHGA